MRVFDTDIWLVRNWQISDILNLIGQHIIYTDQWKSWDLKLSLEKKNLSLRPILSQLYKVLRLVENAVLQTILDIIFMQWYLWYFYTFSITYYSVTFSIFFPHFFLYNHNRKNTILLKCLIQFFFLFLLLYTCIDVDMCDVVMKHLCIYLFSMNEFWSNWNMCL
jgi:hypothetical protein